MNIVADKINIDIPWKDKIAYLLLFLFPLAGMSVRHWISAIFTFLFLHSLFYISKKAMPLLKEERTLLWIFGIFFIIFIVTALINGWTERQTKYLGVEIRYLLVIPIYLMVRQLPDAGAWILRGCIVGGVVLGIQAFYDIEILNQGRATGIYSPNLLGPFAVLVIFWILSLLTTERLSKLCRYLISISAICTLYAIVMSGSRGAFLGFVGILFCWAFLVFKRHKALALILAMCLLVVLSYNSSENFKDRINYVGHEIQVIQKEDGNQNSNEALGSFSARLEMWKLSLLMIKENPVFGIGRGNYEVLVPEYIENGIVSKRIEPHGLGHPHNAYLELLVSKGSIGFMVFSMMLLYPFWFFIRKNRAFLRGLTSVLGVVHIVGFSIFSITDASTFIKGNYVSIFLLFLIIFFHRI